MWVWDAGEYGVVHETVSRGGVPGRPKGDRGRGEALGEWTGLKGSVRDLDKARGSGLDWREHLPKEGSLT